MVSRKTEINTNPDVPFLFYRLLADSLFTFVMGIT